MKYDGLESMSTTPEPVSLTVPKNGRVDTKARLPDCTGKDPSTREMHLLASADGKVPITLNEWSARSSIPRLCSQASGVGIATLTVPYKDEVRDWKALRPDICSFSGTNHDGSVAVDLVDPHVHHLSDTLPKSRGLADFAERFVTDFRRTESVDKTGGVLRVLDNTEASCAGGHPRCPERQGTV